MSVSEACKSAARRLTGKVPSAIFGSSDRFDQELAEMMNEAATEIAQAHDWQALKREAILVGDGGAKTFPLPADYNRKIVDGEVHADWLNRGLCKVRSDAEWFDESYLSYRWGIFNGNMRFTDAIPTTANVRFFYITSQIFRPETGADKEAANVDSDRFLLDERVLMLGIVWRWRSMKRLEYAEDMQNYEIALSRAIARDAGRDTIAIGRARIGSDIPIAFNGVITP